MKKSGQPKASVGDTIQVKPSRSRIHRGQQGVVLALHRRRRQVNLWSKRLRHYVPSTATIISYEIKFGDGQTRLLGSGEFWVVEEREV